MSSARRILLVDDDEDLRESLKDQLALHDEFEIVTAGSASAGIEVAKGDHLDLVLLDVGLPDMDGREACKVMRKNGLKSPIVMLTGNAADAEYSPSDSTPSSRRRRCWSTRRDRRSA
jgi:DNA-binding response OmpR family regulator